MAFKIIQKIKPDQIQDKTLDTGFLKKYYKQLQQLLVKKTSPKNPTGYFFCHEFSGKEDLLIMGKQSPAYLKVFRAAGKGKDGFDKKKVSIGNCFILIENNKKILCLLPNPSLAKGKKMTVLKAMKKLRKSSMKQIADIRWLDAPLKMDAEEDSGEEAAQPQPKKQDSGDSKGGGGSASKDEGNEPLVSKDEIVKRTKELQKGIAKLKNDIVPRFKKKETTPRDAAFVKALRKAGNLLIGKLMQADPKVSAKFSSQKEQLKKGMPQWEKLETQILGQKTKAEATDSIKKELRGAVKRMNETRNQIKELLKKVNFKALS